MKLIREARMGPPKSFKTGAIAGTYPKPLLYFGFDRGGLDIIPSKPHVEASLVKMDVTYDEIVFIKPSELSAWTAKPQSEQPKILALDFTVFMPQSIDLQLKPTASSLQLQEFVNAFNVLANKPMLPWKTFMVDSVTGLTDAILSHISSFNPAAMNDARQWAGMAGGKVRQVVLNATAMPMHVVFLLHSFIEKNELTGEITEKPNLYSQSLRDDFFGLFSQVFYSAKNMQGQPVIWVSDKYPVKGIGPRWPVGLPQECKPDFTSIYGKEL